MRTVSFIVAFAAVTSITGCQTTAQMMDAQQPQAIGVATRRAQFEMNCDAAKGQLVSRTEVAPIFENPRFGGVMRAEYTVGVAGCGQRATYLVICPEDGAGCFAAGGRIEGRS